MYVFYRIVDMEPVDWAPHSAPNAAYKDVIHILNASPRHEEGLLFAYLPDVRPDPIYGCKVMFDGEREGPACEYVAVLVRSTAKSQQEPFGTGFRVTTPGVVDLDFSPDDASQLVHEQKSFSLVGYCGADDVMSFRLDPPRGKAFRAAVVLVSRMNETELQIHKLEYVEPSDVDNAIQCFRKLRTLSSQIMPPSNLKRSQVETQQVSFENAHKKNCRSLQYCPTDTSLH